MKKSRMGKLFLSLLCITLVLTASMPVFALGKTSESADFKTVLTKVITVANEQIREGSTFRTVIWVMLVLWGMGGIAFLFVRGNLRRGIFSVISAGFYVLMLQQVQNGKFTAFKSRLTIVCLGAALLLLFLTGWVRNRSFSTGLANLSFALTPLIIFTGLLLLVRAVQSLGSNKTDFDPAVFIPWVMWLVLFLCQLFSSLVGRDYSYVAPQGDYEQGYDAGYEEEQDSMGDTARYNPVPVNVPRPVPVPTEDTVRLDASLLNGDVQEPPMQQNGIPSYSGIPRKPVGMPPRDTNPVEDAALDDLLSGL